MDSEKNNSTFSLDEILKGDYVSDETFTLESILSEYKRSAFIEGERKTPSQILDEKVDEILKEAKEPETAEPAEPETENAESEPLAETQRYEPITAEEPEPEETVSEVTGEEVAEETKPVKEKRSFFKKNKTKKNSKVVSIDSFEEPEKKQPEQAEQPEQTAPETTDEFGFGTPEETKKTETFEEAEKTEKVEESEKDETVKTVETADTSEIPETPVVNDFPTQERADTNREKVSIDDDHYFESPEFADKIAKNVENPDWDFPGDSFQELANEEMEPEETSFFGKLVAKLKGRPNINEDFSDDIEEEEEEEEPDPSFDEEIAKYKKLIPSIRLRTGVTFVICAIMILFTHLYESGKSLPFGIGTNFTVAGGVVIIMQLIAMMLGLDVLIRGIEDLVYVEPGAESLVLISNLVTFVDGFLMLLKGKSEYGMPFSVVSVGSLFFAMWSRKAYYISMLSSLKVARSSNAPYGVVKESEVVDDRDVLKKVRGKTNGFYKNLVSQDVSENIYTYITPLLIVAGFVFAFLSSIGSGKSTNFAHCYAVIMSVATAFPATTAFIMPFSYAVSSIRKNGCTIAGWCGACDIYDAEAAVVTDEDVFPVGSVSLSGVKLFEGVNQRKTIIAASSLIISSGSGISRIFAELLRSQGMKAHPVESFACYEGGGIGGVVDGERVLVGSGAFMNLMGIRVPEKVNENNTVFAAINDELSAVFTVNYVPSNSVHSALRSLLDTRTDVLLAVKDFNVTPNTIQKKFKVSMEGVEYLPIETSYKLSEEGEDEEKSVAAILCREGLAPLSEVITKGRSVKTITEINTVISVASSILGVLLMYFLCKTGSFASASAGNAFIFMFMIELCVIILSQMVKKRS
jgi:hypothetical protein